MYLPQLFHHQYPGTVFGLFHGPQLVNRKDGRYGQVIVCKWAGTEVSVTYRGPFILHNNYKTSRVDRVTLKQDLIAKVQKRNKAILKKER